MKFINITIPLAAFILFTTCAAADIIELKNGRKVHGVVVRENEEAIIVSKDNGSIVFSIAKEDVKSINKTESASAQAETQPKGIKGKAKEIWQKTKDFFIRATGKKNQDDLQKEKDKAELLKKYNRDVEATRKYRLEKARKERDRKIKERAAAQQSSAATKCPYAK